MESQYEFGDKGAANSNFLPCSILLKAERDNDSDFETVPLNSKNINELLLMESLNAITKHFTHVQFRLRQVIDAPLEEKETLLKDLEEFTFKEIPGMSNLTSNVSSSTDIYKDQVICELKNQVGELQHSLKNLQKTNTVIHSTRTECNAEMCKINEERKKNKELHYGFQYVNLIQKLSSILHIMNDNCKEEKDTIKRDYLKKKVNHNHWGDIRAQLEIAIAEVVQLAQEPEACIDSDYMSDSEESIFHMNNQLAGVVRKKLAPAIQDLMQHGLITENKSITVRNSLTLVIGCVPHSNTTSPNRSMAHAWELVVNYYKLKHGDLFNSSPAMKLSQSYNLNVGNLCNTSSTQKFLITVGNIVSTHSKFKRSCNSQFKAFICAGLNTKMLVNWLQLMYRCKPLIEMYYEPWSYAVKTGFEDTLQSLEKLQHHYFNLPEDIAIQQLQNIRDAF